MGWICEECGYENEFSELSQITICGCCGEPASDITKKNALALINAKRIEEERRLKAIEDERLVKLEKIKLEKRLKTVFGVSKFIKDIVTVAVLISVCVVAIWETVMATSSKYVVECFYRNIKITSLSAYGNNVEMNTDEVVGQLENEYKMSAKNICVIGDSADVLSDNICDNVSLIASKNSNNALNGQFDSNVSSIYDSILRRIIRFIHL